jgi:glycosyltransferase involved in cell wall biosynthesis
MDFLVCPSTQDNSPSVIGESLMCGTQVIGAHVGGIPELLKPFGAELFPSRDSRALTQIIMNLNREYDRLLVSNQARKIFGELEIAGQLNQLYLDSLASS